MAKKKVIKKKVVKKKAVRSARSPSKKTRAKRGGKKSGNRGGKASPPPLEGCPHCGCEFPSKEMDDHLFNSACAKKIKKHGLVVPRKFKEYVDSTKASKDQREARGQAMVWLTKHDMRTVIELYRTDEVVTYIPYSQGGLAVDRTNISDFEQIHRPQADYPTGRAAKLYIGFSQHVGATTEAMTELEKLVDISTHEREVARDTLANNKTPRTVTKMVAGKHGEFKMAKKKKAGDTAAAMFKGLIMEGKLTDDQIFAKVQKAFGLDDKKRSYVAWYRNQLKKEGSKPPAAKGTPKKATKKATTKKKATKKKATKKKATKKKTTKKKTKTVKRKKA